MRAGPSSTRSSIPSSWLIPTSCSRSVRETMDQVCRRSAFQAPPILPCWLARVIDEGAGVPNLEGAYQWLEAGHQGSRYEVRAVDGVSAAFRRNGFAGNEDSVEVFTVRPRAGLRAAEFVLRSNVPWLSTEDSIPPGPRTTQSRGCHRHSAAA